MALRGVNSLFADMVITWVGLGERRGRQKEMSQGAATAEAEWKSLKEDRKLVQDKQVC